MTVWDIYWLTRFEPMGMWFADIAFTLQALAIVVACFVSVVSGIVLIVNEFETEIVNRFKRFAVVFYSIVLGMWAIGALLSFVSILMPSNKDLAVIFAGTWATNSAEVRKLPDNVVGVVNKFMAEYIDDKPSAKKEEKKK